MYGRESENKTVEGINRLFVVENRNQSSLSRLLTESPYELETLKQAGGLKSK